jgi:hypothetical protein
LKSGTRWLVIFVSAMAAAGAPLLLQEISEAEAAPLLGEMKEQ